jgi:hypothetical protein
MVMVNINNSHAVHKVTIQQESIVLNVMFLNTGMLPLKDVLPVKQDTLGTKELTNAHAVNYQDKFLELNAFAHHQKQTGMKSQRPAHAHQTPSEINAFHAQPQDNGTGELTPVSAHHQPMFGTELNVSAQLEDTDQTVLNAQPQDTGTSPQINVHAEHHSSGTEQIVSALNHISYIKEDVPNVQMDLNGKIINAKNAIALIKNCKF